MQPSLWLLNLLGHLCVTGSSEHSWCVLQMKDSSGTPHQLMCPSPPVAVRAMRKLMSESSEGCGCVLCMKSLVFYKAYFSCHCVCVAGCVCRVGGQFCVGPLWRWPTLMPCPVVTMETSCPGWLRPRGWLKSILPLIAGTCEFVCVWQIGVCYETSFV